MVVKNLCDSHLHWFATGEKIRGLNLSGLTSWQSLRPEDWNRGRRGRWLHGFGWDQHCFTNPSELSRDHLDRLFPTQPVLLSRADGHASLVNTAAIQILTRDFDSLDVEVEKQFRSGHLLEANHIRALQRLPSPSQETIESNLIAAAELFNANGITHIRDMTATLEQLEIANSLIESGRIFLAAHGYIVLEKMSELRKLIDQVKTHRVLSSGLVKMVGIKVFLDGSLGSQTAAVSEPYGEGPCSAHGHLFFSLEDLVHIISEAWKEGIGVSVHTIGDRAAALTLEAISRVKGLPQTGRLGAQEIHLEHAQLISDSSLVQIEQLVKQIKLRVHFQPCHFLSDRRWLKEKLGQQYRFAFRWRDLEEMNVAMSFGSDSPVEPPSPVTNLRALREAADEEIPCIKQDPWDYHRFYDADLDCAQTVLVADRVVGIEFGGKNLLRS